MARPPLQIDVSPKDQKELAKLLSGGVQQVRVVLRALALLQLAKGTSAPRISQFISLTPQAIRTIGRRYQRGGLESALFEKQRPGAATVLDDSQKQRIIAMVCSDAPEGRARWAVRLVRVTTLRGSRSRFPARPTSGGLLGDCRPHRETWTYPFGPDAQ
jgi:hypothetical protein